MSILLFTLAYDEETKAVNYLPGMDMGLVQGLVNQIVVNEAVKKAATARLGSEVESLADEVQDANKETEAVPDNPVPKE